MKTFTIGFTLLFAASLTQGTEVGQTYQQVVSERGQPQSQIEAGTTRILKYGNATIKFKNDAVVSITPVVTTAPRETPAPTAPATESPAAAAPSASNSSSTTTVMTGTMTINGSTQPLFLQLATLRRARKEAEFRVQQIVNQPPASVELTKKLRAKSFGAEWFHDGATVPDYNLTDVRATQEFQYDAHPYVTSDLNPGVAFVGKDLEFNAMTKYYHTDRTLPKKKLSQPEMIEINRLYRLIGQCDRQLKVLTAPPPHAVASKN